VNWESSAWAQEIGGYKTKHDSLSPKQKGENSMLCIAHRTLNSKLFNIWFFVHIFNLFHAGCQYHIY
jgi:hypothetical protein